PRATGGRRLRGGGETRQPRGGRGGRQSRDGDRQRARAHAGARRALTTMAARTGLRSMTGYGSGAAPIAGGRITVEVRAVNQRFLDVRVTAPREYGSWEAECRETVRAQVARGRVEVHVSRSAPPIARTRVVLNTAAAREHAAAWRRLMQELGL